MSYIRTRLQNGILWLMLDRPPLNILSLEMLDQLSTAVREALALEPRLVVLMGVGERAFSAGVAVRACPWWRGVARGGEWGRVGGVTSRGCVAGLKLGGAFFRRWPQPVSHVYWDNRARSASSSPGRLFRLARPCALVSFTRCSPPAAF